MLVIFIIVKKKLNKLFQIYRSSFYISSYTYTQRVSILYLYYVYLSFIYILLVYQSYENFGPDWTIKSISKDCIYRKYILET